MGKSWGGEAEPSTSLLAEARVFDTPAPGPLGDELKGMFDLMCDGPMPKRLLDLADALEAAFQRGDLHDPACGKSANQR